MSGRLGDDYLELNTPVADGTFDLIAYGKNGGIVGIFRNVRSSPVRYQGIWTVACALEPWGQAEAWIPADKVEYFAMINFKIFEDGEYRD